MIEIKINDEIYTEEQYKKDYVRMMDSLRQDHLGEKNCGGVDCDDCPLFKKTCCNQVEGDLYYRGLETVKIVHKWAKMNPIITNKDMLKKTLVMIFVQESLNGIGSIRNIRNQRGNKKNG